MTQIIASDEAISAAMADAIANRFRINREQLDRATMQSIREGNSEFGRIIRNSPTFVDSE